MLSEIDGSCRRIRTEIFFLQDLQGKYVSEKQGWVVALNNPFFQHTFVWTLNRTWWTHYLFNLFLNNVHSSTYLLELLKRTLSLLRQVYGTLLWTEPFRFFILFIRPPKQNLLSNLCWSSGARTICWRCNWFMICSRAQVNMLKNGSCSVQELKK